MRRDERNAWLTKRALDQIDQIRGNLDSLEAALKNGQEHRLIDIIGPSTVAIQLDITIARLTEAKGLVR